MADQVVITDEAAVKTIEKYAEQKGISKAEAGSKLIATARGRINASRKWAAANKKPAKPRKAKAAKSKATASDKPKRARKPRAPKAAVAAPAPVVAPPPAAPTAGI